MTANYLCEKQRGCIAGSGLRTARRLAVNPHTVKVAKFVLWQLYYASVNPAAPTTRLRAIAEPRTINRTEDRTYIWSLAKVCRRALKKTC